MINRAQEHCEALTSGQKPERGLFFLGSFGTGKTTCLMSVAKAALFQAWQSVGNGEPRRRAANRVLCPPVGIYKFRDLLDQIASEMRSPDPDARGATIGNVCLNSWIFLDDMTVRIAEEAAESPYRWAYEAVNNLIDKLWDQGTSAARLYVTSNNNLGEIAQAFGTPCADRIRGLCEPVQVAGKSFRA